MISKPPELGLKSAEEWVREFLGYFERVRFEFQRVQTIWFPVQGSNVHGDHPAKQLTVGNSAFISLIIPREINQVKEVVVRLIPSTTGTIDWTANCSYGGKNEDESAYTETATANGLAVTDDRVTEIDVTSLFVAVRADDQVGVEFVLDAVTTTTDVYILGLYFKYK